MASVEKDPFGLVGHTLEGRFRIQAAVATGGFGTVYSANHVLLGTRLAIKVLRVPADIGANDRTLLVDAFRNEARALAHLAHPSIVRATDFGVSQLPNGELTPWMALEWIEGFTLQDDLRARLGREGRSPEECLHALRAAFDALGYAHKAGLAHRDVKPANLMYDTHARLVKVLDFGIAKVMSGEEDAGSGHTRTRAQFRAYSPAYAAPEQVAGTRTGPWTDVHAMGLILTEMLTDRAAYRGGTPQLLMAQAVAKIRPSPGAMGINVGEWEAVITRALSLAPRDRYANAHEFLAALDASMPRKAAAGAPPMGDTTAGNTHWMRSAPLGSDTVVSEKQPFSQPPPASLPPPSGRSPNTPRRPGHTTRARTQTMVFRLILVAIVAAGSVASTWFAFQRRNFSGPAIGDAAASITPARANPAAIVPAPQPTAPNAAPTPVPALAMPAMAAVAPAAAQPALPASAMPVAAPSAPSVPVANGTSAPGHHHHRAHAEPTTTPAPGAPPDRNVPLE